MSINLVFDVKGGGIIDFPFQTTTELTYAVLKETNKEKQLKLIRKELELNKYTKKEINATLRKIEALMKSPDLKLDMV